MITEKQCRILRKEYARTQNMSVSAMKAGVDRKTARKYLNTEQMPSEQRQAHDWRTRPDPLAKVWAQAESMLAQAPELEAKALFEHLMLVRGSELKETHLRTFHRRVQRWRGTHGPEKEVMFDQRRNPGDLLQLDWTHPGDMEVSVQGQPLGRGNGVSPVLLVPL